jgi:hypothetical protein
MPNSIFVSYKYSDKDVAIVPPLTKKNGKITVRSYVDFLEKQIKESKWAYYTGEERQPDVQGQNKEHIRIRLLPKISESNITIILISPGMKDYHLKENSQWMPWEISCSLENKNALLGIILPNAEGRYDYCMNSGIIRSGCLFGIMLRNINNKKCSVKKDSRNGNVLYDNASSYLHIVTFPKFIQNWNECIKDSIHIRNESALYTIQNGI